MRTNSITIFLLSAALFFGCDDGSSLTGDGSTADAVDEGQDGHTDAPDIVEDTSDVAQDTVEETVDVVADIDPDAASQIADCVDRYTGCGCEYGCDGGYSDFTWYPRDEGGPFPSGVYPSDELLEIGVARYVCALCDCREVWTIKVDGVWQEADVEEMCTHIVTYDRSCDGCLDKWEGFGE
ncbi:MAG: hypothetical protein ABIJ56_06695 [Pseudomonadota bacterium]